MHTMIINHLNNYNNNYQKLNKLSFKSVSEEKLNTRDIIIKAEEETLKDFPDSVMIPAGSWITHANFDNQSDFDTTVLVPFTNPALMESKYLKIREKLRQKLKQKFKERGDAPENTELILSYVNVFPPPKLKSIFHSHPEFLSLTNIDRLNLSDKTEDTDIGLWQTEALVASHLKKEGELLFNKTREKNGEIDHIELYKNKKGSFSRFQTILKERGIVIPQESRLYLSDKLKVIDQFIDILNNGKPLNVRTFDKYTKRIDKFLNQESINDIYFISQDPNKVTREPNGPKKPKKDKFDKRLKTELEFIESYNNLKGTLNTLTSERRDNISTKERKKILEQLKKFKELSLELLASPNTRIFGVNEKESKTFKQ